ncbi:MAG TPA: asparagine synthase (glutamine-hydrolyzing) [Planctomycetota bacterium]|jgi:asparagine synthase (glutamine-hydrolysing)|nr:asparagine synthase (glutamine-hydrolyzing) [Planctomycetota bacterium]OQC20947.1 MAG: Asparagine synthetase (glutamine-hydrolyzing) 1 [Planctomycetes bacterium ADurb.Bin069]HNR98443.1 asparagine synthase (glutamine-hydrolyzing) [Planctomycetota bacterium]HNU25137.1 asparagine synthase (glutamine-hydrolyzing) [Planctomycetota bacterium]HOE30125.1 asparagine synthase (glutamine-hydrolyzing) [Planctomycetota bacterium]
MCGICGIVAPERGAPQRELAARMAFRLAHRGPDEFGTYADERAALGHARLSIGVSAGDAQPFHNADRSRWIVHNGAVFNSAELREELRARGRSFHTDSDAEVILHAYEEYGPDCLLRFNGQFAFAVWDRGRRELFLARDRVGVRPLFWLERGGAFFFASEMKAFLEVPGLTLSLDPQALAQTVTFWSPLPPRTPFKEVRELEPGTYLLYDAARGSPAKKTYWRMPFADQSGVDRRPLAAIREEFHALLVDASRLRLRAEAPVGAYLSGGLDSAVVAAIIKGLSGAPLKTFAVSFQETSFDESGFQRAMVAHLGADHHEVVCTNRDIAASFPQVVWFAEKPLLRTAPAPFMALSRLVREHGCKVVLSGEGADEMLGGYDIFKEAAIRAFWARDPRSRLRAQLFTRIYPWLAAQSTGGRAPWRMVFAQDLERTNLPWYSHAIRWRATARIGEFLSADVRAALRDYDPIEEYAAGLPPGFHRWPLLHKAQLLEIETFLAPYLLASQGDRMGMANGTQGRFPFLDHRVMEFCARLRPELKLYGLTEKYLLKQAFGAELPAAIVRRPKQPYRAPIGKSFFADTESALLERALGAAAIAAFGVLDAERVARLVARCGRKGGAAGEIDNMALAFAVSLQLLCEQFLAGRREPAPPPGAAPVRAFGPGGGE